MDAERNGVSPVSSWTKSIERPAFSNFSTTLILPESQARKQVSCDRCSGLVVRFRIGPLIIMAKSQCYWISDHKY